MEGGRKGDNYFSILSIIQKIFIRFQSVLCLLVYLIKSHVGPKYDVHRLKYKIVMNLYNTLAL